MTLFSVIPFSDSPSVAQSTVPLCEHSIFPRARSSPGGPLPFTGPDPRLLLLLQPLPLPPVSLQPVCLLCSHTAQAQASSGVSLRPSLQPPQPSSLSAFQPPEPSPALLVLPRSAPLQLLPHFSTSVNVQLPVVPYGGSFQVLVPRVQEAALHPATLISTPHLHPNPRLLCRAWAYTVLPLTQYPRL